MKHITFWFSLLLCLTSALNGFAQLQVSFPVSRAVFQRNLSNNAAISITGTYATTITHIEARVVARNGQGVSTNWQTIVASPQGGVFNGPLTVQGGWYDLSVRLMRGTQEVTAVTVERVGVGEVFVIAGQSNAQGVRRDGESAQDDRVSSVNYQYDPGMFPADAPFPEFTHLDGPNSIAPRGVGSWCWGPLGDLLTARLGVPVLFFNAAFTGTSVRNWAETAVGEQSVSDYIPAFYERKHPYFPLRLALQNYTHMLGVRAVLWHQGETDNDKGTTTAQYIDRLQTVIRQSRTDYGKNVPWMVARASYMDPFLSSSRITDAQNQVIASGPNVFAGPNTDGIQVPRSRAPLFDGIHFDNPGLRQVAAAWDASLNGAFLSAAIPISPAPAPVVTINCPGNNATTYTVSNYTQVLWDSGETGTTLTRPAGGPAARAKVKDALGNLHYTPVLTTPSAPTIQANGPTRFCQSAQVVLSSSQAQGIVWNTGATTQSISVTSTGNFSATLADYPGCPIVSNTIPISITPNPVAPTITVEGSLTSCAGDNTTLLASPATTYRWSNGERTQRITVSQSGSYSLIVEDGSGCISPGSQAITAVVNPRPATLSITPNGPTTFCADQTLTLNANAAPNYEWSSGQISAGIVVTQSGNYSVRTRNAFNCPSFASNVVPVTVNPLPNTPLVTSERTTTFCQGESTVLSATNSVGATYAWSNGVRTPRLPVTQSGTYSLTVIDDKGCSSAPSNQINVLVNPVPALPQLTASGRTIFCANESVTLTASPETAYQWSNGQTTRSILVNQSGRYSVRTRNTFNCVSDESGPINVTVNALPVKPTIVNERPTTFCAGDNTTLLASTAPAYNWSNGAQSQRVVVTQAGTYSLTVSDLNGCVSPASDAVTVVVNPLPDTPRLTASGNTTFCANESVTLTSTPDQVYLWNTGQITRSIGVVQSGTYSVRTRNQFSCQSAQSNIITVLVNPLPPAPVLRALGSLTFCEGDRVVLQVTGPAPVRTIWSTGDSTQTLTVRQAGSYTARIRDGNGCLSPGSQPLLTTTRARPAAPQLVQVGTYVLEASGAPSGERYYWRRDADSLQVATPQLRVNQSGVYSVRTAITYSPTLVCLSLPSGSFTYQLPNTNQNISVYPNPSPDGNFTIESLADLDNAVVTVYTLAGQCVFQSTPTLVNGRRQLPLYMLTPGPYIISIQTGNLKVSKRIQVGLY